MNRDLSKPHLILSKRKPYRVFTKNLTMISRHGTLFSHCILADEQIIEIRKRWALGVVTQTALASEYNVNRRTICDIVNRRTYKQVWGRA
jgi:hypothetical protein